MGVNGWNYSKTHFERRKQFRQWYPQSDRFINHRRPDADGCLWSGTGTPFAPVRAEKVLTAEISGIAPALKYPRQIPAGACGLRLASPSL